MPQYNIETSVFDPIRFTISTSVPRFLVDTWYDHGLITQELYTRLPGLPTLETGRVLMSSGMAMMRPRIEIGVQINNIRALPVTVYIVDQGPADLLLGGDFLRLLFDMGVDVPIEFPRATIEPPSKREKTALAVRLLSESEGFTVTDFERFVGALRTIHNCSVVVEREMLDHGDWPREERERRIRQAVAETLLRDVNLSSEDRLQISWIESGSIWVTIKSGAKSGVAWLSKLFRLTMDAKLEKTMAEAATAREKEEIARLTREEIVHAKRAEEKLKTAKAIRKAREEWRKTLLEEIDFREQLCNRVKDDIVRKALLEQFDSAIEEISTSKLYAMIEHEPDDPEIQKHLLPKWKTERNKRNDFWGEDE